MVWCPGSGARRAVCDRGRGCSEVGLATTQRLHCTAPPPSRTAHPPAGERNASKYGSRIGGALLGSVSAAMGPSQSSVNLLTEWNPSYQWPVRSAAIAGNRRAWGSFVLPSVRCRHQGERGQEICCGRCGVGLGDQAQFCSKCGQPRVVPPAGPPSRRQTTGFAGAALRPT